MLITLYITRVLLNVLGKSDYGTYEVVGSIVAMFAFLSSTMATAAQRFFAMELGVENHTKLKQIFNINVLIFVGLALVILVLAETVGWWYFNNKLNIPPDRFEAAAWVYQFSVFTSMVSIITIPYMAIITAREHMQAYAYLGIIEVILKLGIVFVLIYLPIDKLKLYAILAFSIQVLVSLLYIGYSTRKFPECRLQYYWNKTMFNDVFGFSSWSLIGALAMTIRSKGIDLLLNSFFDELMNAARGIAYRVYNALYLFVHNFFTAIRPQLIKSYSADPNDNSGEMMQLVFQSSKFCYYLMWVLSLPILVETQAILDIWLKEDVVPDYAVIFTRLIIINAIVETLAHPFIASIQATGKIKKYQIVTGSIILLNLPLSYLFLRLGFAPQITMYVSIMITTIAHFSRIYFMSKLLRMNILNYIKQVIFPILWVTIFTLLFPLFFYHYFNSSLWRIVGVVVVTVLSSVFIVYFIGLEKTERETLKGFVMRSFAKYKRYLAKTKGGLIDKLKHFIS